MHDRFLNLLFFIKLLQLVVIFIIEAILNDFLGNLLGLCASILFGVEDFFPFSRTPLSILVGCRPTVLLLIFIGVICRRHHIFIGWQLFLCFSNLSFYSTSFKFYLGNLLTSFLNIGNLWFINTSLITLLLLLFDASGIENFSPRLTCGALCWPCPKASWNIVF